MKRALIPTLFLGAILSANGADLTAQQQRPGVDRPTMTRQQMEERVLRQFDARIATELGLEGPARQQLAEALADFRNRRAPLLQERMRTTARMGRHLSADGSEEEARAILNSLRSLRTQELALQNEEEERLLQFLAPSQLLQLHQMRDQFAQRIRRLESGGPPGGAPRRPGGGS